MPKQSNNPIIFMVINAFLFWLQFNSSGGIVETVDFDAESL